MTRALEDGAARGGCCSPARCVGFALPHQDAAGVPRGARRSALVYLRRRADAAAAPRCGSCSPPARAMVVAAGWWVAIVELIAGADRPYIGGSQDNSVLEPDLRLQRLRPDHRQRDRQRRRRRRSAAAGRVVGRDRAGPAVQRRARRPDRLAAAGRADRARRRARRHLAVARAPTGPAPRSCSGAAGCSSPAWCSASPAASSTRTTRSRSPRRSPRWSASAPATLWRAPGLALCPAPLAAAARGDERLGLRAARPHARLATRGCATLDRSRPACAGDRPSRPAGALAAHGRRRLRTSSPSECWPRSPAPAPTRCDELRPPAHGRASRPGRPRAVRPVSAGPAAPAPAGGRRRPRRRLPAAGVGRRASGGRAPVGAGPGADGSVRPGAGGGTGTFGTRNLRHGHRHRLPGGPAGGRLGGLARLRYAESRPDLEAEAGRVELPLGRRHRRRQQRRGRPACRRRAGDGDRRLQRHRPGARRSPSSRQTYAPARSTTSSEAQAAAEGAWAARAARTRSRPGSPRPSPPRRSVG